MSYFLILGATVLTYMSAWFVVSIIARRNDVADVAWGLGFVVMAWASFLFSGDAGIRGLIVTLLVSIWGLRLASHVYSRNRGKPEDYRYHTWRETWGAWFYPRSFVQIYLLQGALLYLIAVPVLIINRSVGIGINLLDIIGIVVWCVGFFFESVGDAQLARFIHDPANKGHIMQQGLWAYSRHPNYFGEVTQWWGIWIVALSVPLGIYGIIGPITITFLILKVSGVPLLEKKMAEKPEFASYKKRVSVFIPLPPRADA